MAYSRRFSLLLCVLIARRLGGSSPEKLFGRQLLCDGCSCKLGARKQRKQSSFSIEMCLSQQPIDPQATRQFFTSFITSSPRPKSLPVEKKSFDSVTPKPKMIYFHLSKKKKSHILFYFYYLEYCTQSRLIIPCGRVMTAACGCSISSTAVNGR